MKSTGKDVAPLPPDILVYVFYMDGGTTVDQFRMNLKSHACVNGALLYVLNPVHYVIVLSNFYTSRY